MYLLKVFLTLFVIYVYQVHGKVCNDDCVLLSGCPNAVNLAINRRTASTEQLIKDAFCGFEYIRGTRTPKVCCSDFGGQEKDEIETHPNVALLPDSCGDIDGKRIVGGTVATLYEFPWMALISYDTRDGLQFLCGGSIINSRYVLTAAHCVRDKIIAGVRIGEYDIRYKTDCQGQHPQFVCESHLQDVLVEDSIIHEKYQGLPLVVNDIALLRLKKPVDFSFRNAGPICLPISAKLRNVTLAGQRGVVAGWGLTELGSESSVLLKVTVPIHSGQICQKLYNRKSSPNDKDVIANEFCAGELNKDSCSGDSGGPMMLEDMYNGAFRTVQYGIVSRGPRQCGSNVPGVYTDVTKFMKWILDNIKS